jgi:RecG-like helicase
MCFLSPTVPVPFNLTEIARKKSPAQPLIIFTAKPIPKAILEASWGITKKKELPLTLPVSTECLTKSKARAMSKDLEDEARKTQEAAPFNGCNS